MVIELLVASWLGLKLIEKPKLYCELKLPKKVAVRTLKKAVSEPKPPVKYENLFKKYFGKEWETAYKIAKKESGLNPRAVNYKTNCIGLMQINCNVWCKFFKVKAEDLKDPETNIRLAKIIYDRNGWNAWTTYKLIK